MTSTFQWIHFVAVTTSYKSQATLDYSLIEISALKRMTGVNKDGVLGASLILSIVSLALLFGVTWHLQSSINLLRQHGRKSKIQDQDMVKVYLYITLAYVCSYIRIYIIWVLYWVHRYLHVRNYTCRHLPEYVEYSILYSLCYNGYYYD